MEKQRIRTEILIVVKNAKGGRLSVHELVPAVSRALNVSRADVQRALNELVPWGTLMSLRVRQGVVVAKYAAS
jgi:hypothetical protein